MKIKIVALYFMLVVFVSVSIFSLWQFVIPLFQDSNDAEELYAFDQLQELVEISDSEDESNSKVKYDAEVLLAQNSDFVGWLAVTDTTISFPIVQGDDNSFYLNHGFDKRYSSYGCPFLDIRTPVGGDNLVIHGHNMGNNRTEMFSSLLRFQNPDYAIQHKTAYFSVYSSNTDIQYELFSVVNFNSNNDISYLFSKFENSTHREEFIQFLKNYSLFDSEFVPDGDILILSTCNRTYGKENRLLLCYGEITSP